MGCVYEITFPDDSRYIGMTAKAVTKRLNHHRCVAKTKNTNVSQKVREFGLTNEMADVYFETDDPEIRALLECELIAKRRLDGFVVLNNAEGGFGPKGTKHTQETTMKTSAGLKGKTAGEKNFKASMSDETAKLVIASLHEGASRKEIIDKFNISYSTISQIAIGRTWNHIERPVGFNRIGRQRLVTDSQVLEIRQRNKSGIKSSVLATEFGLSVAMIKDIVSYRAYKNLKD